MAGSVLAKLAAPLATLLLLASCGASGAAPAPAKSLDTVIQAIPTKSFGSILPGVVGVEKGFYREEGIDLETPIMASGPSVAALTSGQVDLSAGGNVIRAAMQGAPLKNILFYFYTVNYELVAAPDIKSINDLRGKRIGYNGPGSSTGQIASILLHNAGIDPTNGVVFVTSPAGQEVTTLVAGAIDAIIMNPDAAAKAVSQGMHVLVNTQEVGHQNPAPQGGWGVTDTALQTKRDLLRRWVRATVKSLQFLHDHPDDAVPIAASNFGLEPDAARGALQEVVKTINADNYGGFSLDGIKLELANDLDAVKGEASVTEVDRLTDQSLLRQAQQELGVPCKAGYGC